MNQILAAVVTYNRLNMLKDCVSHIAGQSVPADIMIVDNASTDGTKDWAISAIKEYSESIGPNIRIIYENTGANLGGAGGFNYAMRLSCELGYDYIWIMDDDAFPEPDCLEKLMSAAEDLAAQQANDHTDAPASAPSFGFLSSVVLWTDGSLCKMNCTPKSGHKKKRRIVE